MKIIQTGINEIPNCCCGGLPPPAGSCDYTGSLKAYVANPCGPYVVNPIDLLTATANDLRYAPDEVPKEGTTVLFGTFESGGDCNAHLNAWFWCDEGSTYRLVLDGYFNDGYQTPVKCGADAGTTDCDCVVVTFEISCEGCTLFQTQRFPRPR